ncbi:PsbP-related protein [Flavobacterium selenitireducens]|uniref:PsbP-related protein n=1 Tax=Flavobacterium selenitireducens TaxID=2722704 RepID=UPI00168AFBA0|nr:PsbP-related protein [Flavobacterium selenitireducens]MBD3581191.1 hypothetical protein [Flavobacterium selenitireducens]
MKKALILLMPLLCIGAIAQPQWSKHIDKNLGIEISYPRDWKPNYKNPNKSVSFTAAKIRNGKTSASLWIHISDVPGNESLDSLTLDYMKTLRSDGNLIHGGNELVMDGRNAYSFHTSVENNDQSKISDFYLLKTDSKFYILALIVYQRREYDSYKSDFQKIIESLKINNP